MIYVDDLEEDTAKAWLYNAKLLLNRFDGELQKKAVPFGEAKSPLNYGRHVIKGNKGITKITKVGLN